MRNSRFSFLVLAATLLATGCLGAAPNTTYLDPAAAGPDYQVQGEYVGESGDRKLSAQVIALGNGTFQAVFYAGGLPGEGWDGKTRVRVDGRSNGTVTEFAPNAAGWQGTLNAGALQVKAGEPLAGWELALRKVTRRSPTEGAPAPAGARVLFDGKNADAWVGGKITPEGLLECGSRTRDSFRDFTLHLEFRTPFKPEARGQSRGNSGVYIFGRYEVQILDSFGLDGVVNECGAIYRQKAPAVNACYPPLTWQTYDIDFRSPRFDGEGKKVQNGVITVRHNGIVVHDRYELPSATGGGQRIGETGAGGPILIQNHGNPVMLRNVWLVDRSQ